MVLRKRLVQDLHRGKKVVGSGYLASGLAPAPWEAWWCHTSQSPANNTLLSCSLSWGLSLQCIPPQYQFSLERGQESQESGGPLVLPMSQCLT